MNEGLCYHIRYKVYDSIVQSVSAMCHYVAVLFNLAAYTHDSTEKVH